MSYNFIHFNNNLLLKAIHTTLLIAFDIYIRESKKIDAYKSIIGARMRQPPDGLVQIDVLQPEDHCWVDENEAFEEDIVIKSDVWQVGVSQRKKQCRCTGRGRRHAIDLYLQKYKFWPQISYMDSLISWVCG